MYSRSRLPYCCSCGMLRPDGLGESRSNVRGIRGGDGAVPVRCVSSGAHGSVGCVTIGSGVAAPSFTTCSGLGVSGACVTSRGQYTRPMSIPYDANARARTQIYRQCMQAAGWSEQSRSALAPALVTRRRLDARLRCSARGTEQMRSAPRRPPASPTVAAGHSVARAVRGPDSRRRAAVRSRW